MHDQELIEWVKELTAFYATLGGEDARRACRLAAAVRARLEQLSGAAAGSPLTPSREAEIRYSLESPLDYSPHVVRELFAALDWERAHRVRAEGVIQDQCAESALYEAGVREERAAILALVRRVLDDWSAAMKEVSKGRWERARCSFLARYGTSDLIDAVAKSVAGRGSALSPPHAVTHARMLRLEAALARIATAQASVEFLPVKWAREALEDVP